MTTASAVEQFAGAETKLTLGEPNLVVFARTLMDLAEHDRDVVVVCSDSRGSGKLTSFAERFPDQLVETGIAEQCLVGVAAGLASCGKKVFAVSPASFLTARSFEQIKNDVCYTNNPVTLVGISAGVSYGALGSTHHSLHDLAATRSLDHLTIVVPADNRETEQAVRLAAASDHPVYLRFGKAPMHDLPREEYEMRFGKADVVRQGDDLTFIATGEAVRQCYFAAERLADTGISARVVSMHTVKPIDEQAICDAASQTARIITAEEHSVCGGLGEACAAVLQRHRLHCPLDIVGMPAEPTYNGSQAEIMVHYGIDGVGLANRARNLLEVDHG